VAIVGTTGSGKATIVSLLLQFYDVQQVASPWAALTSATWILRRCAPCSAFVLQDVHLFSRHHLAAIRSATRRLTMRRSGERWIVHAGTFIDRLPGDL
jgi:ABC-type multidrug transport system fused ATPase/permease subunit